MLEIRKIRGDFGAEARGVDLARPVDPEVRRQLNEAAAQHAMLVIKGQSFDARQFLEAGRVFGEPMTRPYANPLPDLPLVQRLSSHDRREDGSVSKTGPDWHTDQIDDEHPPSYTLLYAVELFRTGGGTTGIIDMRAVYDALPGRLKERIEGLKAAYGTPRTGRVRPGAVPPGRGEAPPPPRRSSTRWCEPIPTPAAGRSTCTRAGSAASSACHPTKPGRC